MSNANQLATDLRAARLAPQVTITKLRREAPDYAWRAERTGAFGGWQYRGTPKGDGRDVMVYARAMMCGDGDDDFVTLWYADDGTGPRSYPAWWLGLRSTIEAEV